MSDDAIQQNQNDLPAHWQVHTAISGEKHHDDSPLFPPIKEKPLIAKNEIPLISNEEELMLPINDEELLTSGNNNDKIETEITSNFIIENKTRVEIEPSIAHNLIEDENNTSITTPINENLIENKVIEKIDIPKQEFLVDLGSSNGISPDSDISNKTKIENINISETHLGEVSTSISQAPKGAEVEILSDSEVFINNEDKAIDKKNDLNNSSIKNSNIIKVEKIIPVPHMKIHEAFDSAHPIVLPPRVIPFSTPAPSVHTKIAAVYTQPDARASVWLPWMRTSMWTKKMVKRATKHPEVIIEHENLPSVISNGKPNVVYSPVYISPDIQSNIVKEIKEANIFEKGAGVSRIDFSLEKKMVKIEESNLNKSINEVFVQNVEPVNKEVATPLINDSFDAAILQGFNVDTNPILTVSEILKPKVNDSFDAALFNDTSVEITQSHSNSNDNKAIESPKIGDSWDEAMFL